MCPQGGHPPAWHPGSWSRPRHAPQYHTRPSEAASPPCHAPGLSAYSQPRLRPGSSGQRHPFPSHPDLTSVAFLCLAGSYMSRVVTTAGLAQGLSAAGRDLHPGQSCREACSREPGCQGPSAADLRQAFAHSAPALQKVGNAGS